MVEMAVLVEALKEKPLQVPDIFTGGGIHDEALNIRYRYRAVELDKIVRILPVWI
jgi:hypothetical protein